MKKTIEIIIAIVAVMISSEAIAQKNLKVEYIFEHIEDISRQHNQVYMKGDNTNLKQYGIELFRSVTSQNCEGCVDKMRDAALEDGKNAVTQKLIVKDGVTVACYYQLTPIDNKNRFVLFRQMNEDSAMLIYIEGDTTLDNIVNIKLNKK